MCVYATCTSGAIRHGRIHHGRIRATRHRTRIDTGTHMEVDSTEPHTEHRRKAQGRGRPVGLARDTELAPVEPERHSRTLAEMDTVPRIDLLPVEAEPMSRQ